MRSCKGIEQLASVLGIGRGPDGFFLCREWFRHPHDATREGIYLAGCATGIKPICNCMIEGASVASRVAAVLREADGKSLITSPPTARGDAGWRASDR
jgi:heterodisulfide reductase subunit A-like polyferredoxin